MNGGGSNSAQKEATREEERRRAEITRNTQAANAAFDSPERQAQYNDFYGATRDLGMQDLNQQKTKADLNAKFALARSGQTGGSRSRDVGTQLGEDYIKGLLTVDQRALGAKSDLMGADNATRQNVLSMVMSGMDLTTANSNAAAGLRSNLESGKATRLAGGLGELFGGVSQIAEKSEQERIRRAAEKQYGQSSYQPFWSYGGGG
jgi:hypothetical protein